MAKRLNLKDKMEEINERFSYKNKAILANDVLENKLMYILTHLATSEKKWAPLQPKTDKKWLHLKLKLYNYSPNYNR